jgi:hypothetical protein
MTDTQPTNTAVGDVLPPRVRALIYVLSAMLAAAYGVIEANTNVHWGWLAGYAAWNAGVGLLAVSNTAKAPS